MSARGLVALKYAASVGRVMAWPDEISDGTIRMLRRRGYVETHITSTPWPNIEGLGGHIDDEITAKGRAVLGGK